MVQTPTKAAKARRFLLPFVLCSHDSPPKGTCCSCVCFYTNPQLLSTLNTYSGISCQSVFSYIHTTDSWFNRSLSSSGKWQFPYWFKDSKVSCLLRGCSFYLPDQSNHLLPHVWLITDHTSSVTPPPAHMCCRSSVNCTKCWFILMFISDAEASICFSLFCLTLIKGLISWRNMQATFHPKIPKINNYILH